MRRAATWVALAKLAACSDGTPVRPRGSTYSLHSVDGHSFSWTTVDFWDNVRGNNVQVVWVSLG